MRQRCRVPTVDIESRKGVLVVHRETPQLPVRIKAFGRRHVPQNARGHIRRWVLATPMLSDLYYATDPVARTMRLHRGTEIVIDGFPRSANTFAVESFRVANPDASLAHHLHDARRIRRALRWKVPTILIIREPDGCVNSFVNAIPTTRADFFYRQYARFYESLVSSLEAVVIADFAEVTTSWSAVIERFNQRFGTAYAAPGTDARDKVLERVDDFGKSHAFGQATFDEDRFEKVVSRPSGSRIDTGAAQVATPHIRQRALDIYARVIAARDQTEGSPR